ncbi:hypothetical protein [Carboxylicivirga caseinilyticus]|uniref:hypothetical protein n=1 Tax=Carboxylicivirga caseinilyticus TaxID=3417572 RepID=UPI003D32864B
MEYQLHFYRNSPMTLIKRYSVHLIIIYLAIISIYGVIEKIVTPSPFETRNVIAYILIITITLLKIFKINHVKTTLALILITGLFNFIQFTNFSYLFIFSLGSMIKIEIQPVSAYALLALILLNKKETRNFINKLFPPKSESEIELENKNLTNTFKQKFSKYNDVQLKDMLDNSDSYQDEAIQAVKELIEEKLNN